MAMRTRFGDDDQTQPPGLSGRRVTAIAALVGVGVLLIVLLTLAGSLFESVGTDQIMVIQAPLSGSLTWFTNGGTHWQGFGTVTKYPKRGVYPIETQVRFNDGGHGTLKGSVQFELPLDEKSLTALHNRFPGQKAIEAQLIETVVVKAVYMTGPLMSSKESYAEKRNDLISAVEDQIQNGVYRTRQRETTIIDPLTNQSKSAMVVEIVQANGQPARQEESVLTGFKIKTYNFSVKALLYDDTVEKQIQQQQQITMQVQTAIAESRQAEQRTITVEQQGKANSAAAKWEQEVVKQKAVTAAEQQLAVAQLRNKEMDQYKESELKRADADATYRRRIMEADGALALKLDTYLKAQGVWANAFQKYTGAVVPSVVMGGAANGTNAAMQFMDMLTIKAAKDLALDFAPRPVASHGGQ
jgi:hypothetical protein